MEIWCFLFSFFPPPLKLLSRAQRIHKEFTIRLFLDGAVRTPTLNQRVRVALSRDVVDCGLSFENEILNFHRRIKMGAKVSFLLDFVQGKLDMGFHQLNVALKFEIRL